MAELVDALDSKSCSFGSAGSIPASGTKEETFSRESPFFVFKLCKALLLLNINAAPSFNLGVRYLFFKNTSFSSNIEPISLPLPFTSSLSYTSLRF